MSEQTYGQRLVGLSFNPSNDSDVDHLKRVCADLIDMMAQLRLTAAAAGKDDQARYASIAITELQTTQMWLVKAITAQS